MKVNYLLGVLCFRSHAERSRKKEGALHTALRTGRGPTLSCRPYFVKRTTVVLFASTFTVS
jgi:hypothetical protein